MSKQVHVQVKGLDALLRFLSVLPDAVLEASDQACSRTAAKIEVEAKRIVPWRTGNLCRSIKSEKVGESEYRVAAEADYAYWVEYGTSKMREQPYMRPATEKALAEVNAEINQLVNHKIAEVWLRSK